jgi:hypothetical protein
MSDSAELQEQRRRARVMAYMLGGVALAFFLGYILLGVIKS